MKYLFEKPTITPHELSAQIARVRDLLLKRNEIEAQQWVDTVGPEDDQEPDESKEP